jgi:hypothetical protein
MSLEAVATKVEVSWFLRGVGGTWIADEKNASFSAPLALPRDLNGLVFFSRDGKAWKSNLDVVRCCKCGDLTGLTHTGQNGACSGQVAHMLVLNWFEVLMKICVQDWNALLNMLKRLRSRNM